jgi:hypothetical protein
MALLYTEEVPTVRGWYFQRMRGVERIIELPNYGTWPRHWRDKKQDAVDAATDETMRQAVQALPDSAWITEWAGPIAHPEN